MSFKVIYITIFTVLLRILNFLFSPFIGHNSQHFIGKAPKPTLDASNKTSHQSVFDICGRIYTKDPNTKSKAPVQPWSVDTLPFDTTPSLMNVSHNISEDITIRHENIDKLESITNAALPQYIVGGSESVPHSHPWIVSLGFEIPSGEFYSFCGGSILTQTFIITAAHCISRGDMLVQMGHHKLDEVADQTTIIRVKVRRSIVHPDWHPPATYNDIAILELYYPIRFSRNFSPICLPTPDLNFNEFNKVFVTTAGWGRTKYGGESSEVLQEVRVETFDLKACESAYYKASLVFYKHFPNGFHNGFLCAGVIEGGKDSCQGDSGGPLEYKMGPKSLIYLVGLVSTGIGCGKPGIPGLYTNIVAHLNFINQHVNFSLID